TNETRNGLEEATAESGQTYLAMVNGPCAGGGYELALACDWIVMADDGNTSVSLPEVPLLAVLPGTGGLTRLVDKRKVRRDLADVFSTTAEGVKGKRAVEWGLVDAIAPRSKFADLVAERARKLAASVPASLGRNAPGVALPPLEREALPDGTGWHWKHVELKLARAHHTAELVLHGPDAPVADT